MAENEVFQRAVFFLRKMAEHPLLGRYARQTIGEIENEETGLDIKELPPEEPVKVGREPIYVAREEVGGEQVIRHIGDASPEEVSRGIGTLVYRRGIDPRPPYGERAHAIIKVYGKPSDEYSVVVVGENHTGRRIVAIRFNRHPEQMSMEGRVEALVLRHPKTGRVYLVHFPKKD